MSAVLPGRRRLFLEEALPGGRFPSFSGLIPPLIFLLCGPPPRSSAESDAVDARTVPPYPPSPVITKLEWAPRDSIIRRAEDGDNWPVTWAVDDAIYTTWGDGTGFVPKTKESTFAADDGFHGVELWTTDGSRDGTRPACL